MRTKNAMVQILCLTALVGVAGCKNSAEAPATVATSGPSTATPPASAEAVPPPQSYSDPPTVDVGLSVEQAYAAIPHHRTVWSDADSSATPEEKAYLNVMFQLVDEAIAVRVAGLQAYSRGEFDSLDIDGQCDRLLTFARATRPPKSLAVYHQYVVTALSADRQFFQGWKTTRTQFPFAEHIENHPSVRAASAASHAAYNELMRLFPAESQSNKSAFFDYHCALDFL